MRHVQYSTGSRMLRLTVFTFKRAAAGKRWARSPRRSGVRDCAAPASSRLRRSRAPRPPHRRALRSRFRQWLHAHSETVSEIQIFETRANVKCWVIRTFVLVKHFGAPDGYQWLVIAKLVDDRLLDVCRCSPAADRQIHSRRAVLDWQRLLLLLRLQLRRYAHHWWLAGDWKSLR